uniref:Farnesyl pyrophosphate synthase n=1 Tax=Leptinotarsa decemlineata TaxID=7539 RepID=A0A0H4IUW5_LEPDE|nr:farnesyl pyrophosphate synthase-like [Leptinotarsa decemlineata]AKO63325.1 farnesyl pyrophosphate synthase [Leptinotarsa decemlineata]
MFSSKKLALNRTSREIFREIRRHISKTTGVTNSDAISRQESKLGGNLDLNGSDYGESRNKWAKISKQNNMRALSTIQTKVKPPVSSTPVFSKEDSREFMAIFPDIVRDLTDAGRHTDIPEVTKRFAKVLQYNVPTGKKTRGLSTVIAYKMLEKPENLTPENIKLANILGWCVELLRGFGVVVDDVIDNSEVRRNNPCWYRNENVGMNAVIDGTLLESSIYSILRKYFFDHPSYVPILELFHDVTLKCSMGKSLDGVIMNNAGSDLSRFTMKNYNLIMKYRTGYHSFQLPVGAAMYLAQMYDPEQHRQAKTILLELGQFYQIQKDFLNCFGDSQVTWKLGSHINEGKCSWLAVVALQRANPSQRKIMEKYYGQQGEESVEVIKNLYIELGLPATYACYEEESYKLIHTHIQQISKGLPHKLFFTLLDKLFENQ